MVRNLDDSIKRKLRVRAAAHGRSMEEEVRQILTATVSVPPETGEHIADAIRRLFAPFGDDFELDIPPRLPERDPPDLS
jgi:plasmid stability protein